MVSHRNARGQHPSRRQAITAVHVAGLTASLVAVAVFATAIPTWNANFFHNTGPARGDWTDALPLVPLGTALIYHAACLLARLVARPAQATAAATSTVPADGPGGDSGRALLIHTVISAWVLTTLAPALFIAGYGSLFRVWRPAVRTQSGILVCNLLNVFARECEPVLYTVGSLQIAGLVFGALVWTLHFTLLLAALHRWRRHALIQQLQREKMAHYHSGDPERRLKPMHRHRRGGPRSSPSSTSPS